MALSDNDFLGTGLHGSAIAPIRLTKTAGADAVDPGVQEIATKDDGTARQLGIQQVNRNMSPRPQPHHARGRLKMTVGAVLVG
jgi:hypothetical protein